MLQNYIDSGVQTLKGYRNFLAGMENKPARNIPFRAVTNDPEAVNEVRKNIALGLQNEYEAGQFEPLLNNHLKQTQRPSVGWLSPRDARKALVNELTEDTINQYHLGGYRETLPMIEHPDFPEGIVSGGTVVFNDVPTPTSLTPRQQKTFDFFDKDLDLEGWLSDNAIEGGLDPMTGTGIKRSLAEYYNQPGYEPLPSPWDDTPTAVVTPPPTSPETAVLAAKVDDSQRLIEASKQQLAGAKTPSKAVTQQDLEPTKGATKTVTKTPEEQGKEWLSLTPEQRSWAKLDYAGIDYSGMDSEQLIQAANGVNEQFYKAFPHFRVAEWKEKGIPITPLNPKGTTQQPSSQGKPPEYSPIGQGEKFSKTPPKPKPEPPILPERGLALSSEAQNRRGYSKSYDVPQYEPTQASKAVAQPVATDSKGIPLWQLGLGGTGLLGVGYLGAQAMLAQQEKDRQQLGLQLAYGQMPNYY